MRIEILGETLSYLRFNCIWPRKGQELRPRRRFYVVFVLMLLSTASLLIGSAGHLVVSLKRRTFNISEDAVIIIAEGGVYYYIVVFVANQKRVARIFLDLSDFGKFGKAPQFDERNGTLMRLSRAYKNFIDLAIVTFCLWPFAAGGSCRRQNERREFKEVCGLLVTTWMPFDVDFFPLKQILYGWQCYAFFLTMKGAALVSFAFMESMEHVIVRIQHLKILLKEAVATEDVVSRQKALDTCIKYHVDIFDISARIDKHYSGCLFLHIFLTGALFGCIGHRFMESFSVNSLCIFNGWLLSLYIICRSGQNLIDEGLSVADVAYSSQWYDRDVSCQRTILIMMMRSQKPITVHAGPFSHLSHVILLTIFKTAYSYLTLLSTASK